MSYKHVLSFSTQDEGSGNKLFFLLYLLLSDYCATNLLLQLDVALEVDKDHNVHCEISHLYKAVRSDTISNVAVTYTAN